MNGTVFIDCFTVGIDEIPVKLRRHYPTVLKILDEYKRFSVFEATANQAIARTMTELCAGGYLTTDNSCGFPWTNCELTELGRKVMMATTRLCRTHSEFIGYVQSLQRAQAWYSWKRGRDGYVVLSNGDQHESA